MKKLTNTAKVLRYVRRNPKAKAKEVSIETKVPVASVYQIMHKAKKDQALTMSASPAVLLKYPPKRVTTDNVNHPAHYKVGGIETIDFIEAKSLNYNLGNVVKYVSRARYKVGLLEDLKKAEWYLKREIATLEKK